MVGNLKYVSGSIGSWVISAIRPPGPALGNGILGAGPGGRIAEMTQEPIEPLNQTYILRKTQFLRYYSVREAN